MRKLIKDAKGYVCPVCGHNFVARIKVDMTAPDERNDNPKVGLKDNPLWVTCVQCGHSMIGYDYMLIEPISRLVANGFRVGDATAGRYGLIEKYHPSYRASIDSVNPIIEIMPPEQDAFLKMVGLLSRIGTLTAQMAPKDRPIVQVRRFVKSDTCYVPDDIELSTSVPSKEIDKMLRRGDTEYRIEQITIKRLWPSEFDRSNVVAIERNIQASFCGFLNVVSRSIDNGGKK